MIRLRRAFFWKGDNNITGGHCLVSWEVLCTLRCLGGLEIRRLRDFNTSQLSKWWWKYLTDHKAQVLHYIYHHRLRPLDQLDKLPGRISPFWCGVLRTTNAFKLGLRLKCGLGNKVRFWTNRWIGEVPLAYAFPSLFEMASDKEAWVSLQIQDNNWALTFRHPLSLIRLQALAEMVNILRRHTFWDDPDQLVWKVGSSSTFIVRSQYNILIPPQHHDISGQDHLERGIATQS